MVRETGAPCAVSILSSSCLFSIIIAVSLPAFYNADITRINLNEAVQNATGGIDQVRFGNWNYCLHRNSPDIDPCQFFSPCNLSGEFRMCSPPKLGYELKIQHVTGMGDINVPSFWTRAFIVHALAAGFAILNLLMVLMRRPNGRLATLSLLFSFVAAIVSVAFRHFAGNRDAPGMVLAVIACMLRSFECAWTFGYREYRDRVQARRRIWKSLSSKPLGPIYGNAEQPLCAGKDREVRANAPLYDCPLCMDHKSVLVALTCWHVFCERCIKFNIERQVDKRCPLCNVDATVGDLRMVTVEEV